ncbi:2-C-methyl-D-erythritol 4-phosphate cytidylyltransferase [Sediminibacillus albus]|uniref:2-C-methyl-D-erythritol 4-phosphate cytidylyltransferase n=1 Tax=Sediminibacillus albus TaxID=407036 RepID=A0A1G9D486_9BACI|nr:2-C-methyl-D-erythritol 4-phosphate cytidylyltransferase [Sediminibacillus albus]SDK58730.1 2-C-methyl-D-erythritol 4-phosphate cytidylyltransferase/2-C-methyl-D-erythritol 4-phosphate cytidylyltransferase / 2-C-methyl-D-erythritol 2,4-cyclodiphosphate synthase [Sediminibacillus albus]
MRSYHAIVLAAGQGKRMKAGENKQFIKIRNKPLIIHTLELFNRDSWCTSISLVVNPKEEERIRDLINNTAFQKNVQIVKGGKERQQSVFEGLKSMEGYSGMVFIHDGARPFVSLDSLHELAEATFTHQAALLAVPVTDTIKQVKNNKLLETLDRSTLWAAQTPQGFHYDMIFKAHQLADEQNYTGTDDASLVERTGQQVEIVQGSYDNIKITTPEDLKRAQAFIDPEEPEEKI